MKKTESVGSIEPQRFSINIFSNIAHVPTVYSRTDDIPILFFFSNAAKKFPVKLRPISENSLPFTSLESPSPSICSIKTAHAEISFYSGLDERIIQTVMRDLKHLRNNYTSVKNIYIICGKTVMRKGIDGLTTLIQDSLLFYLSYNESVVFDIRFLF
ncbi:hypothetical protein [Psychrobacillus sp. OK032]|uniref:hypothetical protein n=1 Tax=Psychrobacillus sp. OK032 TaxID=1884358 RepID=UPI0008D03336|nr:hypothetical protein [Psychrobacillus sp. OK032]SES34737.1 hypothetical protein SAMN05518872_108159 [Psychrobacillus sp. OK032]